MEANKPIPYIEPYELADWMDNKPSSIIVVDVRDNDFENLKIPGSRHIPFPEFFETIPKLIDSIKLQEHPPTAIVFHCTFWFVL